MTRTDGRKRVHAFGKRKSIATVKEIVQGRDSLVAKESKNRLIHRLLLPSLQDTQCIQVVDLTHNQTVHCPEDGVDVREPNPASTETQRFNDRLQLCKANGKHSQSQQQKTKRWQHADQQAISCCSCQLCRTAESKRAAYHQPGMLGCVMVKPANKLNRE